MGWISTEDKMPPEGLQVLLEASGRISAPYSLVADHDFFIGSWIVPEGKDGFWMIYDSCSEENHHFYEPTVHAWMPLPKHYAGKEMGFSQDPDLMEHAMFEDDPEWLYKGDAVYEQMSFDDCDWTLPMQEVRDGYAGLGNSGEVQGGEISQATNCDPGRP